MSKWDVETSVEYNRTNDEYEAFYAKVIKKCLPKIGVKDSGNYQAIDLFFSFGRMVIQQYEKDLPKKWLPKTKE